MKAIIKRSFSMAAVFALIITSLAYSGCKMNEAYVKADRLTYDAVAPAYADYFENDPNLTEEQKESKRGLMRSWNLRISEAEKSIDE